MADLSWMNLPPRMFATLSLRVSKDLPQLEKSLKKTSIVYSRHGDNPMTKPQLTRHTRNLRLKDWQRYGWKVPDPDLSLVSKYQFHIPRRSSAVKVKTQNNYHNTNDSTDGETSSAVRKLPPLPRNKFGYPMLRRPIHGATERALPKRSVAVMISDNRKLRKPALLQTVPSEDTRATPGDGYTHLKMIPFKNNGTDDEIIRKYSSRLPPLETKRSKVLDKGNRLLKDSTTCRGGESASRRRRNKVRARITKSDEILHEMENDLEDKDPLITELRSEAFNPTVWPWNLKRYRLSH